MGKLLDEIRLNHDEYEALVNAIDDKIYNLNAVIDRSKYNKVWYDQIIVLHDIKKRLRKTV
jgi:hypothetical protein